MEALAPSIRSLTHRAQLNTTLSTLRRERPRVPFFRLAAHRTPTLWTLYRGLLRASPSPEIQWRVGALFRKFRHLTSPSATRVQLLKGHKWLEIFEKAKAGDQYWTSVLQRYSRLLEAKREKELADKALSNQLEWREKLRNRPILTGGFLRPSKLNKPLPRLKPQPIHISMMIRRRRDARQRRLDRSVVVDQWKDYLVEEREFEEQLDRSVRGGSVAVEFRDPAWSKGIDAHRQGMRDSVRREEEMAKMKISPELWEIVKQARREKIVNKTREKERERRGELTNNALKRMRQGLPAHLISMRGETGVRRDKWIKDPSEGGYAGKIKKASGMKLKNDTEHLENHASPEALQIEKHIVWEQTRRARKLGSKQ